MDKAEAKITRKCAGLYCIKQCQIYQAECQRKDPISLVEADPNMRSFQHGGYVFVTRCADAIAISDDAAESARIDLKDLTSPVFSSWL